MREKLTLLKTTRFVAIFAAAMLLAGSFVSSARAMVLSLDGGGIAETINAGFSLGGTTGLSDGDAITEYSALSGLGIGLRLSGPANVRFEYLGSEAADTNTLQVDSGAGFTEVFTQATPDFTVASFNLLGGGLVPFRFTTTGAGGGATNGGPFPGLLHISFADLGDGSFIALFGDGSGDNDHDDFAVKIAVSPVPLPAAVWLFISAILGLVSVTRIRRTQNAA